ncbi:MAG: DUF1223 domain-containing protein [Spartobacteria bacterium]
MHKSAAVILAFLIGAFLLTFDAHGGELSFTSDAKRTHLIELFTSEGCSSCPPAETRLGKWKNDDRLWHDFVPIALHVDYWDRLGWKDRFARSEWTRRQQAYADRWSSSSIYTPEFVLDGHEWKDWSDRPHGSANEDAGVIEVRPKNDAASVSFRAGPNFSGGAAHVAWLGFNVLSNVRAGENSGRSLRHDFVVLRHATGELKRDADGLWTCELMSSPAQEEATAIACWIESDGVPIQATGGWLSGAGKK